MLVEYVDTIWYQAVIVFTCLFTFGCLIYTVDCKGEISNFERKRKNHEEDIESKIDKCKQKRKIFFIAAIVSGLVCGYLNFQKDEYSVDSDYDWIIGNGEDRGQTAFKSSKRKYKDNRKWYEKKLHTDWYKKEYNENIDETVLSAYEKNVEEIYNVFPNKEKYDKVDTAEPGFQEKMENYKKYVNSNQKGIDSKKLWQAYKDGKEVCKVYYNSENVFQTGVLAESASASASIQKEERLLYTAGMVDKFEEYLQFSSRDIGNGVEVTKDDVAYRSAKGYYRISTDETVQIEMKRHCGLLAYASAQYAYKYMQDAKNALRNLILVSKSCLHLMNYLEDIQLKAKLCQKVLDQWEDLEAKGSLSKYKTEGESLDDCVKIKESLEGYTNILGN